MFTKIADFLEDWKRETNSTERLFDALTDASLSQEVTPGDRTLGRIAAHIAFTIPEMLSRTGLEFTEGTKTERVPTSAEGLAKLYCEASAEAVKMISSEWKDESLFIEDDMYGQKWIRGITLTALIRHEIHHRGQMTILMRQAGLVVPGVYGPAKEEWAAIGMTPPEI
jgi:uncharacterized damage-inducible protein DinB